MTWSTDSAALQPLLQYATDIRWSTDARMALSGFGPPTVRSRRRPTPQSHHDLEEGSPRRSMPRSITLQFRNVPTGLALKLSEFYRAHRSTAFSMVLDSEAGRNVQVIVANPPAITLGNGRASVTLELQETLTSRQTQG